MLAPGLSGFRLVPMRTEGSGPVLEARRRLAVGLVLGGEGTADVAEFLGVHATSVRRWARSFELGGDWALAPAPVPGRPPKLTAAQEARVLQWVGCDARAFGFDSDWWTAPRLARVVEGRLGVRFHPRYLNDWLARRGVSPQVPALTPRERDCAAIGRWFARDWPAIKRGRRRPGRRWCSPTRAGC